MKVLNTLINFRWVSYLIFGGLSFSVCANTAEEMVQTIRIQGSVISPPPVWAWQIYPGAAEWARDWSTTSKQGVYSGQVVTFSYTEGKGARRWAFLQGFMRAPAEKGAPNITPIVSVTDKHNQRIVLNGNTIRQEIALNALGDAGSVTGTMLLSFESAYAVYYKRTSESGIYYRSWINDSARIGVAARDVIITNQTKLYDYYPNTLEHKDVLQGANYNMTALLNGSLVPDAYDLLGGFTSHMSKIKTIWPRSHVPSTWQASLTVDVGVP